MLESLTWSNIMGFGITGILQSLSGTSDKESFGSKPKVPPTLDYASLIAAATQSNIKNMPSLLELGNLSTEGLTAMMEKSTPGVTGLRDTTTSAIKSQLAGEVTDSEWNQIRQRGAEIGVQMGTKGAQKNQYDTLRHLGIMGHEEVQRGISNTMNWMQQAQNRTFDFSKMLMTPAMAIDQGQFNWYRNNLAANVAAAPDPQKRGALDVEAGLGMGIMGMFSGMKGGGGGGGWNQAYKPDYSGMSSPSGNSWGGDYGHESFFGGTQGGPGGRPEGPGQGTGEGW